MRSLNSTNTAETKLKTVHSSKKILKEVSSHNEKQNAQNDRTYFEWLYDTHAPKAFGFITKHTNTKEQAEEYMMNVFLKVWDDIKNFNTDEEKKIQQIVLMICRPLFKNKYQSN